MDGVSTEQLSLVRQLYDRALCAQALREAESIAPLRRWNWSATARVLAGRLAANLGAPKLADAMHYRAWREYPNDPEATYYYSRFVLDRRGLLPAWEFLKSIGDLPKTAPAYIRADWYAQHAAIARSFRDFDIAEAWLDRAQEIDPQRPWLWVERSSLFEAEDRYDECLAAARKALEIRPGYRPAVQSTAHALQLLDRDEEALDLLVQSAAATENFPVMWQLAMLQYDLERYDDAKASLDRCENLSPLMEKPVRKWIASRKSDIACIQGDFDTAIEQMKQADSSFHKKIMERLSVPENRTAKRAMLPVGFVRQHHLTCAPATLAAISRFWSMPADHLAVVEEICYDGTPHHSERNWAETHGWATREFNVTWDSVVTLIDRGVPFTLTTVEPGNGHLQAVIGYDARRGTILMRDPYVYYVGEAQGDGLIDRYKSTGPRGMALVPRDKANLLDGLELKDSQLWDRMHAVQRALARHERDSAATLCDELAAAAPEHLLTINARRSLAAYDADTVATLGCLTRLLALFPDDANFILGKLSCLRALGRMEEYSQVLQPLCAKSDSDALFWQMYAQELGRDARKHPEAERLLRRAIRYRPRDAASYSLIANILWERGQREAALELYRFSACLEDKQEGFSRSYFNAARHLRKTSEAMKFLQARFNRFGTRSGLVIRTLFWAMEELGEADDGFILLDRALQLRPEDGDLLLYGAICNARYARHDAAQALLDRARGKCSAGAHLRCSAELAGLRGDLQAACGLWRQVCQNEPLDVAANSQLTRLLAETESSAAALAHLRAAGERFPHHYGLKQLLLTWLRDESLPDEAEPVVRELVAQFPDDVWARRELAITLLRRRQTDAAMAEIEAALRLDPSDGHSHALLGQINLAAQRSEPARAAFCKAINLSVDIDYAITGLLDACNTTEQKREALSFVRDELRRQTIFGDGLLTYRQRASELLDKDEVLVSLREALEARPDLWHAHSALIQQRVAMDQAAEAAPLAEAATERFPLLPALWLDRAAVFRARNDMPGELAALEKAVQINPDYGYSVRELAGALERNNQIDRSRTLLEQAVTRSPLDAFNHGCLAWTLWTMGEKDKALESITRAVTIFPGYDWAWSTIRQWAGELRKPELVEKAARDLVARRPGEARSWMILAESLDAQYEQEKFVAIDRAIELSPRAIAGHDLKARLLEAYGRIDQALTACRPESFVHSGEVPPELRARAAIINWNAGRHDRAVSEMNAVIVDSPQYQMAWYALLDWYRAMNEHTKYRSTAERVVSVFPHDPRAHGYLGEAYARNDNKAAAKGAYARALRVAPDYTFAAYALFDLQLNDDELDSAKETLVYVRRGPEKELVAIRELELVCRQKDLDSATAKFRELCNLQFDRPGLLDHAADCMEKAGWAPVTEQTLQSLVEQPDANPLLGDAWMGRLTKLKRFGHGRTLLDKLIGRGDLGAHAAKRFIEDAAAQNERSALLSVMKKHRKPLQANIITWGSGGYALSLLHLDKELIKWMVDWRTRQDSEQWMLSNLIACQRRLGRDTEAAEATRLALSRRPDATFDKLRVWAAIDRIRAGEIDPVRADLKTINVTQLGDYYHFLHLMADAACMAASLNRGDAGQLIELRIQIENAERLLPGWVQSPELQRVRLDVLKRIRKKSGLGTPWWCRKRLWGSRGIVAPAQPNQANPPQSKFGVIATLIVIYVIVQILIGMLRR